MNNRFACIKLFALLCAACTSAGAASEQNYPARPVRFVVPYPPGAGVDIITRLFTPELSELLGQQFIVDNRAGAAGNIGAEIAARATNDGYHLLMAPASIAISHSFARNLRYNLKTDFDAIVLIGSAPFVLVVHPSLPVKTTRDLIALAKASPGKLSYASSGTGSPGHLTGAKFNAQAGIDMLHVPFKGTTASVTDVIGGRVSLLFGNTLSVLPHVKAGRLRALGITSAKPSSAAPGVVTIAESGLPGYASGTWFSVLVPKGTPRGIIRRLNAAFNEILKMQDTRDSLARQGVEPRGGTAEEAASFIAAEIESWAQAVAAAGAHAR